MKSGAVAIWAPTRRVERIAKPAERGSGLPVYLIMRRKRCTRASCDIVSSRRVQEIARQLRGVDREHVRAANPEHPWRDNAIKKAATDQPKDQLLQELALLLAGLSRPARLL